MIICFFYINYCLPKNMIISNMIIANMFIFFVANNHILVIFNDFKKHC